MKEVAFYLSQPLSLLSDYWLEIRCCWVTLYPLRLLYRLHPVDAPLQLIIERLRCKHCQGRAREIYLTDQPQGAVPDWTESGAPGEISSSYLHLKLPC